jgi:hypothetical protein
MRKTLIALVLIVGACGLPSTPTTTGPTSTTVTVENLSGAEATFQIVADLLAPDGGIVPTGDAGGGAQHEELTIVGGVRVADGDTSAASPAFAAPGGTVVTWKFIVSTGGMSYNNNPAMALTTTLNKATGTASFVWNADSSMTVGY